LRDLRTLSDLCGLRTLGDLRGLRALGDLCGFANTLTYDHDFLTRRRLSSAESESATQSHDQ
jgi:hypothetical protein